MTLTRRTLLHNSITASLWGSLANLGISQLALGATNTAPKTLVIVHLRGGCDGFNLISPATDPVFIAARPADLRVTADGEGAGIHLNNGPDPTIDFRLHPAAAGLAELYQQGQLAIIHAVGLTNETRSHFVATDMLERGVADEAQFARSNSGWLARYLDRQNAHSITPAASIANAISGEFSGYANTLALPTLDYGFGLPGGQPIEKLLADVYKSSNGPIGIWGQQTLAAMQSINRQLSRDGQGKIQPYQPGNGINYNTGADLGRGLKTAAQLIKMNIGLSAISVELGGWDTHEGQPGRFKTLVDRLSSGLCAFWNDMAGYHDNLLVLTITEFGRRLRANRSNGTDHGRASAMLLIGGNVVGGHFHGDWPGLASTQLDEGVDLAVATDYRRVLSEVLTAHAGHKPPIDIFPSYEFTSPLGLFKT